MTKHTSRDLRSRAEARLAQRSKKPPDASALSTELDVHRVELELQNEELRAARDLAETALGRYTEVFDFAPIGYAVLAGGQIREINHAGAGLLGAERGRLVGKRLAAYIAPSGLAASRRCWTRRARRPARCRPSWSWTAATTPGSPGSPPRRCRAVTPRCWSHSRTSPRPGARRPSSPAARSRYAQPDDVARSRSAGFDSHLAKPATLARLQAELAAAGRST